MSINLPLDAFQRGDRDEGGEDGCQDAGGVVFVRGVRAGGPHGRRPALTHALGALGGHRLLPLLRPRGHQSGRDGSPRQHRPPGLPESPRRVVRGDADDHQRVR